MMTSTRCLSAIGLMAVLQIRCSLFVDTQDFTILPATDASLPNEHDSSRVEPDSGSDGPVDGRPRAEAGDSGSDGPVDGQPDADARDSGSDGRADGQRSAESGDSGLDGRADAADGKMDGSEVGPPIVPAFYVATTGSDSNAGTVTEPFATLGRAQMAMQESTTIKTTYVRKGSYTLPTLSCGGSSCGLNLGTADNGETWSYYPPDGVDTADLSAGSTANGTGLSVAISVSNTEDVTITGLAIHDFQYAGINSSGATGNLLVENNAIYNGYTTSGSSNPGGVSCYGCANTTISHNVIHDLAQFGISISNVNGNISNLLVTGNVFYNTCTAYAYCGAIYVQDSTATATNLRFTSNYIHDGNTFASVSSGSGAAVIVDDCTSNVTASGNVLAGRNGANTTMVHGGSNVRQIGNLFDLADSGQRVTTFQTSGASGCSDAAMSGNEYESNLVISGGGGGGYALLSGSPQNSPTITNNDYYNYAGAAISAGSGSYSDTNPIRVNPELSGWTYEMSPGSPVLTSPVNFPPLIGGWGPPGYVLPHVGTAPSSPH